MNLLGTDKYRTWTWGLLYDVEGAVLELYYKRDSAELLEQIIALRPVNWLLMNVPGGFSLWDKALKWCYDGQVVVFSLPLTKEQFDQIAPDDERYGWWFEKEAGEDESTVGSS